MPTATVALCVAFSLTIFIGVVGNTVVASVFMAFKTLRRPANIFIVNMSICNSLFMLSFVPYICKAMLGESWIISHSECQAIATHQFLSSGASIICMAQLAFIRYVAILRREWMKHFHYKVTIPLAGVSWLWMFIFLSPMPTKYMRVTFYPNMHGCIVDYSYNITYTVFVVIGIFLPTSILILVFYWKIFKEFRLSTSRVSNHQDGDQSSRPRKGEFFFALQLFVIFVLFQVSLLPPVLIVTIFDPTATRLSGDKYLVVEILVILHATISPYLFFVFHKPFRGSFVQKLRCRKANVPGLSVSGGSAP
ncbi:hypothetical protein CAPTEDRAFT_127295 [Capitella teleta]|uniref:G-protein coupled receptors family 1 profile domain-containing protein n=1 Tax=Capitella teleta TaxID=283909 RepID=R7UQV5_CAPTE|nr:hypothetical protein CAPTEDRAFT_127295 [Capitella teleta]|eukprot:ELU08914.1 hypothetical protein CAPTEDRAFT_127295 [Capitella teleta]